ncbi:MAG: hypothetical protein KVP17_002918 [Porospora cf. gigantea B]|uniref:uncharacterized protein n=1 Tax=Porospora cf. gigantea B TaxID=2853592 RepID=UPI0035718DE7|nr:MAG: hypothetical protein KVP17_002918 [Porospora cf. gigantea B]
MTTLRLFGLLHIRIKKCKHLRYHHEENQGNMLYNAFQMASCYFCACGYADACCGKADPFVKVTVEQGGRSWCIAQTRTVANNHHPEFKEDHPALIDIAVDSDKPNTNIVFEVLDDDFASGAIFDVIGRCKIPLAKLLANNGSIDGVALKLSHGKARHRVGELQVGLTFTSMHPSNTNDNPEVPLTYFPSVVGNDIRLYQDADVRPGSLDTVMTPSGPYQSHRCWMDLYESINQARHFIFIVGWSVDTDISLVRAGKQETVGEMLVRKAEEGCTVQLMLWDDGTSGGFMGIDGVMGTKDEYTMNYFRDTRVECRLSHRPYINASEGIDSAAVSFLFTHHQKVVCLDTPTHTSQRTLMAYFGGIDITGGRYDWADHKLFGTLGKEHAHDFYNGCLPDATVETGPREPWHDIHGRVVGPAAWDLLQNYVERARQQQADLRPNRVIAALDGVLVDKENSRAGDWCCQVFRSIDAASAKMTNKPYMSMFRTPELAVDRSIQAAYLYQIERAKSHIYLENQYFIGSAQYWVEESLRGTLCFNLVPDAICRKIESKIEKSEPFTAYCLLPLFPEGVPESAATQEILHFQYQTVRMMYTRIAKAIKAQCLNAHPYDYLMFFFVGNRDSSNSPPPTTISLKLSDAIRNRRHQIYVHSKMIIVDDEYVLIGSANINERSMNGHRDSEIACGMWEPNHRAVENGTHTALPHGEVSFFRRSLWTEHCGRNYDEFADPNSYQCVRKIRELAEKNLSAFLSNHNQALPHGHLCQYPYHVDSSTGETTHHPKCEFIPDTEALLCGQMSATLINLLTT